MARLESITSPTLTTSELSNPLIFVVDMINGFVKEGALADPAILQAAKPIADLIDETKAETVFICDSHEKNAPEFANFPPHCLKGSRESEVIDELKAYVFGSKVIEKNTISAAAVPGFYDWLDSLEDGRDLIVTGCCTDLCVAQLALPLQFYLQQNHRKSRVIIPVNCVDTYDNPELHPAALHNQLALDYMKNNGIVIAAAIEKE